MTGKSPKGSAALRTVLEQSRSHGFLGPGPVEAQLEHSAELGRLIGPFREEFLDLGSGGGLPGLVLANLWPTARAVLLDSQRRRCAFLQSAVEILGLAERVDVRWGRAERLARDPGLRGRFDLVVARSFAAPPITAECAVGFIRPGGRLVVTEPPAEIDGVDATRWPEEGLAKLGLSDPEVRRGVGVGVVFLRAGVVDDRWPRREGIPAKRPVW